LVTPTIQLCFLGTETGTSQVCDKDNSSFGVPEILEIAGVSYGTTTSHSTFKTLAGTWFLCVVCIHVHQFTSLSAFEESLGLSLFSGFIIKL
jgi:hypothetical protein